MNISFYVSLKAVIYFNIIVGAGLLQYVDSAHNPPVASHCIQSKSQSTSNGVKTLRDFQPQHYWHGGSDNFSAGDCPVNFRLFRASPASMH